MSQIRSLKVLNRPLHFRSVVISMPHTTGVSLKPMEFKYLCAISNSVYYNGNILYAFEGGESLYESVKKYYFDTFPWSILLSYLCLSLEIKVLFSIPWSWYSYLSFLPPLPCSHNWIWLQCSSCCCMTGVLRSRKGDLSNYIMQPAQYTYSSAWYAMFSAWHSTVLEQNN